MKNHKGQVAWLSLHCLKKTAHTLSILLTTPVVHTTVMSEF